MPLHPLSGVYAASLTPLKKDFSIDLDSVLPFLDFLAKRGCHGALLFGTTGEGPSFAPDERNALLQKAQEIRKKHPRFRILAGTGTPSLQETIDLTRSAFDLGCDGVVTLPPYYFRKATDDGLFAWFSEVIRRAVPRDGALFGYHFPSVAGIGFSLELIKRIKDAFPVQFAGLKDSSHDEALARKLGEMFGESLCVLNGTDSYLKLAMEAHAGGCITAPANLLSPVLRELFDAQMAGQPTDAVHARISELRHITEEYMPFPPALKALVARLHGFPLWPVRPPLSPIAPEQAEREAEELLAAGYRI